MRYTKRIGIFVSAVILGLSFMAVSSSAQIRVGVRFGSGHFGRGYYRPRVVERFYSPFRPVGYYGYGNPYRGFYSERREDRQALGYAERRLDNDEYKFYSDGYITPKEQQKLDSDYYKLNRDKSRLRNDW